MVVQQTLRGSLLVRAILLLIPVALAVAVLAALDSTSPKIPSSSGTWTHIDDHTIALTGNIDLGNLFKFRQVFDEKVQAVVLNSGGGLTYEAIQIGMILKEAGVDVVVDGVCLSSCANYLFTAGHKKTIRNGIVGFHGNTQAATEQKSVKASIQKQLSGLSEAERKAYRAELKQTIVWERAFFADLGIDQALFERTQRPDKGMGNGKTYAFLLPTLATFRRYGVHGVEGVQNLQLKRAVEREMSLPLFID